MYYYIYNIHISLLLHSDRTKGIIECKTWRERHTNTKNSAEKQTNRQSCFDYKQ